MITSKQNQTVKNIAALSTKKYRDKENLFVIEGIKFVAEITADWNVINYVLSAGFLKRSEAKRYQKDSRSIIVADDVFQYISQEETPQGILAVVSKRAWQLDSLIQNIHGRHFFVAVEKLQDPGNLGTLIRTAHGLGAHGVLVSKGSADVYNSKTLRSSAGSFFHLPVVSELELPQTLQELRGHGIKSIAADVEKGRYPFEVDFKDSFILLLGNEGQGLSREILDAADLSVKIPMPGGVESFNAGIAAGIIMYEAVRQRCNV